MSRLRSTPGRCIIRLLPAPEETRGGIVLPEMARKRRPKMWGHPDDDLCWHQRGVVESVGEAAVLTESWTDPKTGRKKTRERYADPEEIEVGDVVIFGWCDDVDEERVSVKLPDVAAIDFRTAEELSTV